MWLHPCLHGSKTKPQKAAEAISSAYSFSARKSSCADWKSQNMRKTWFSKADCSSIPSRISIAVLRLMWIFCSEGCQIHRNSFKRYWRRSLQSKQATILSHLKSNVLPPIAVAKKYAGIGASLVAKIKNTKTPFGIDFGVGDVIVPRQEKRKIPTQLDDFEAPAVNTYSLETTVAEKLDAILTLMEFSSRMKDYYDLCYLANKFDFDGATLTEALKKTFENRGHKFTVEQFGQVMVFGSDDAMQKKWKAFCRKIDTKTDDYNTVLRTIKTFLADPYKAAVTGNEYTESWSAYNGSWTRGENNNG